MPRRSNLGQLFKDILDNPGEGIGKHSAKVMEQIIPEFGPIVDVVKHLASNSARTAGNSRVQNIGGGSPKEVFDELKEQQFCLLPVLGLQGGGKTVMSIYVANQLRMPNNFTLGMKEYQRPDNFKRLNNLSDIFSLPKRSTVIIDDAAQAVSLGTYSKARGGEGIINMIADLRHAKTNVIFNVQSSAMVNRHMFDTITCVIVKKPNLSAETERPMIRKAYARFIDVYKEHSNDKEWIWPRFFMWSHSYEGLVHYDASSVLRRQNSRPVESGYDDD